MYNPFDPDTAMQVELNNQLNMLTTAEVYRDAKRREKKLKAYIKELEESLEKWQAAWKKKDNDVAEQNINIGYLAISRNAWRDQAKMLAKRLNINEEELKKEVLERYKKALQDDPETAEGIKKVFPEWLPENVKI